jgi:DNA helicase HerA-like ATPase
MTSSETPNEELQEALEAAEAAKAAAEAAQRKADELAAAAEAAAVAETPAAPADTPREHSELAAAVIAGYSFEGSALEMGALVEGDPNPDARVRIPFGMLNRHGLVAGATGTGKTKTLQVLAEQISAGGVPVFAADIKGDLSGISVPGTSSEKLLARCESIGQGWQATASPTEFFALGSRGTGVPIRATVESFGSLLLSKVLGLNETQESSLALVFYYAEQNNLPLITIEDLRATIAYLTSDEGKTELKNLGGLSKATAGVILRELIAFAAAGGDEFFGEPEFDINDFLRTAPDGRGIVSLLEVPGVADQPALFSTFLMYLLRSLFAVLPEVGDQDKPKLVFFFDEAHLLFKDASKDFLETITQTVRLIRSKGVGVFFVTQTPKDVPSDVLAQLGSRVQHQLRAHTPQDAKALKATVSTYPNSGYDLGEVLTQLATGEAIVTVMNEKGAPTPVAWTRLRAPQGSMDPAPAEAMAAAVSGSLLASKYAAGVERAGAAEALAQRQAAAEEQAAAQAQAEGPDVDNIKTPKASQSGREKAEAKPKRRSNRMRPWEKAAGEASRTLARELVKSLFKKK